MSAASTRYPPNLSGFPPAGHRSSEISTEGAFVQPQPTPHVRYASRIPLQYDGENDDDDHDDEWMRTYYGHLLPGDGGFTISAATGRRLSPIRAFGQQQHRRTASLDNIVDGIEETSERSRRLDEKSADVPVASDNVCKRSCRPSSCWGPQRFSSRPCDVDAAANKIPSPTKGPTPTAEADASGLKTKLKSISDKYLKNPVAGMMISGRDTLTSSLLSKIKLKHQSHKANGQGQQWEGQRSSFRSFSCGTLPALDEFHRKQLLVAASSGEVVPEELSESMEQPSSPIGLRIEGDSDSGIVPEWSDTSSISESSYIRHYQPCQLLSSWRKPQPKVRRSLSPIFQYRALHNQDDQVDSSTASSTAYETLWPASKDTTVEENDTSVVSSKLNEDEPDEQVPPVAEEEPVAAVQLDAHTTRIHVEYPASPVVESAHTSSQRSYQTASLDRRILAQDAARTVAGANAQENGTSVHLVKIERDPDNLKAELGIFIAKKKLTRGSVGYLVAHIVPGGLVDRYFNINFHYEIYIQGISTICFSSFLF